MDYTWILYFEKYGPNDWDKRKFENEREREDDVHKMTRH